MVAKTPFKRLTEAADELDEKGFVTEVDRTDEESFYILPEKSLENDYGDDLDMTMLKDYARGIVVERHDLHFYEEGDKWVVSVLPESR